MNTEIASKVTARILELDIALDDLQDINLMNGNDSEEIARAEAVMEQINSELSFLNSLFDN